MKSSVKSFQDKPTLQGINPQLLLQGAKREKWRRDVHAFFKEAVYIEDRDVAGLAIPFVMWDGQASILKDFLRYRLVAILKARQLGLSWMALSYAVWRMLFRPGYSVVALSKRENPDAKELARRMAFILNNLPKWLIRQYKNQDRSWNGATFEATSLSVTIYHPKQDSKKQPDSTFQSLTSSADSGRSFTANLVILDEWAFQQYDQEIWSAAYPTINRPTGGQVIGISTGKKGTLFEEIFWGGRREENGFKSLFLPWWADPRRTPEWYKETQKAMPNTYRNEYPATPEDAFLVGHGSFFPEWDYDIHVKQEPGWYPPDICELYGAYDAGYGSRACFKWYAVFPNNKALCYREYYPAQTTDPDQAKRINELSKRPDGTPERLKTIWADPACWNKQSGTGESTAEIFLNHQVKYDHNPIILIPADNDLSNGWRRLHQWLVPPKDGSEPALTFSINCGNSIRTYPGCEQSKTNPEDISSRSEHHPQDVDRYFVMGRPHPQAVVALKGGKKLPPQLITEDRVEGSYSAWS